MPLRYCMAKNCYIARGINGIKFHRLPNDDERCKTWLRLCGREDLIGTCIEKLHRNYYLCSAHFEDNQYMTPNKFKLCKNALPTKFEIPPSTSKAIAAKIIVKKSVNHENNSVLMNEGSLNILTELKRSKNRNEKENKTENNVARESMHNYCLPVLVENEKTSNPLDNNINRSKDEGMDANSNLGRRLVVNDLRQKYRMQRVPKKRRSTVTQKEIKLKRTLSEVRSELRSMRKQNKLLKAKLKRNRVKKRETVHLQLVTNPIAKAIIDNELKFASKNHRSWTDGEKCFWHNLFFTSAKAYRLLRTVFHLPCVNTLRSWLDKGVEKSVNSVLELNENVNSENDEEARALLEISYEN